MSKIVDEIIDNLNDRSGFDGWWGNLDDDIQDEIKGEIEKSLTLQWIPILERLPEKGGHYLVRCSQSFPKNYRGIICEFYEDNQLFYGEDSEDVHEDATHWCELPDADL